MRDFRSPVFFTRISFIRRATSSSGLDGLGRRARRKNGIISTASRILGVASAAASKSDVLLTGVAGLVAGAMSMATGEYVSVSSQSDTERADLAREVREL